jgi:hypothetical protein
LLDRKVFILNQGLVAISVEFGKEEVLNQADLILDVLLRDGIQNGQGLKEIRCRHPDGLCVLQLVLVADPRLQEV